MLCIKEGENNTKFCHKMANSHRRYNHLGILKVDGMIYEESEVVAQVVQFYKKIVSRDRGVKTFGKGFGV